MRTTLTQLSLVCSLAAACGGGPLLEDDGQGLDLQALEAEGATLLGGARAEAWPLASGGRAVGYLDAPGAGLRFVGLPAASGVRIRYATANAAGRLGVSAGGVHVADASFPGTGGWGAFQELSLAVSIPTNGSLELVFRAGDVAVNVDRVTLTSADARVEGERGALYGGAQVEAQAAQSGGAVVAYLDRPGAGVRFVSPMAASQWTVHYTTPASSGRLALFVRGTKQADAVFPGTGSWTTGYRDAVFSVSLGAGDLVELRFEAGGAAVNVDYVVFSGGPTPTPTPTPIPNIVDVLMADMGPSQAIPHGIESWLWAQHGVVEYPLPSFYSAAIAMGVVYRDTRDTQDTNTRVALRDLRAWVLDSSGRWTLVATANGAAITGSRWPENFAGATQGNDTRIESDGSISQKLVHGYNWHFFLPSRFSVTPGVTVGVVTQVSARKIVDNPALPDDRSIARYVAGASGDWWRTSTAPHIAFNADPALTNAAEMGSSRMRLLTNDWQTISFTNVPEATLRRNPPPL